MLYKYPLFFISMKKLAIMLAMLLMFSYIPYVKPAESQANDEAYGVAVDSNGDIVVVGQHEVSQDKYVMRVEKYGSDGILKWQNDYDADVLNVGKAVAIDANGYIYAGGAIGKEIAGIPLPSTDYLIVKYDKKGNKIMDSYSTPSLREMYNKGFTDILNDMAVGDDGYIYATGMTFTLVGKNLTNIDFWTIKVNPNNLEIEKEHIFDNEIDAAFGIDVRDDTVVVVGSVGKQDINKYCVVKYDSNLNVEWAKIYYEQDKYSCAASDAVILPDGSIAVTGWVYMDDTSYDILTILFDKNGNREWKRIEGGDKKDDGLCIASDSKGNIIVAGYKTEGTVPKWYIIKYTKNGNVLWDKVDDVVGQINRIAVDGNDNIIAVGYEEVGGEHKYCIRKYSPEGELLWEASAGGEEKLEAYFTWSPETPTRADAIHFYDKSKGNPVAWEWDFGDGTKSNQQNPVHQYNNIGTYDVTLTVWASDGSKDSITRQVVVVNAPPYADFTYSPLNPVEGQEITFDASKCYDKDGSIANYTWNFGDGNIAYGKVVSHSYASNGTYKVTLTIKDSDGATKSVYKYITVNVASENAPPIANFVVDKLHAKIGEEVSFDASASYDPDGNILFYRWDWNGDGIFDEEYTQPYATHKWLQEGTYTVVLQVEDNNGSTNTYSKEIEVKTYTTNMLIVTAPAKITLEKGKEKEIEIRVRALTDVSDVSLMLINKTGNITISLPSPFNLTANEEKVLTVKIKAQTSGVISLKAIGSGEESDVATVTINLEKGSTPSFTLPLLIIAVALILLYRRRCS